METTKILNTNFNHKNLRDLDFGRQMFCHSNSGDQILLETLTDYPDWAFYISNLHSATKNLILFELGIFVYQLSNEIKLIRRYLNEKELLDLVTSNFYLVLYYNSEIGHLPSLRTNLKHQLLSAFGKGFKICLYYPEIPDPMMSFIRLHEVCNRATPNKKMQ